MSPTDVPFWDAVDRLRERDGRYQREAYGFVVGALGVTVGQLPPERHRDPVRRHLSGQELLEGIVGLARHEFGFLAPTVFREWGLEGGEDVGRIVFQLVDCHQLSARPEDTAEDFRGFDLLGRLGAGVSPMGGASGEAADQAGAGPESPR